MVITSSSRFLLAVDNVSRIPADLSDAYCRLSTGMKYSTRELFTTGDVRQFNATNPVIYNGIPDFVGKDDLRSRLVKIELQPFSGERVGERKLWKRFDDLRPYILGALFDLLANGLSNVAVNPDHLTRMADTCEWIAQCQSGTTWKFVDLYMDNVSQNQQDAADNDLFVYFVKRQLVSKMGGNFQGTATELLLKLADRSYELPPTLQDAIPKSANALSARLKEKNESMRKVGVVFDSRRTKKGSQITLTCPTPTSDTASEEAPVLDLDELKAEYANLKAEDQKKAGFQKKRVVDHLAMVLPKVSDGRATPIHEIMT
ncbi:MAG: hypothetical protein U0871_04080 [Gemmataceae bacterium]